jgi:hypothetical protein
MYLSWGMTKIPLQLMVENFLDAHRLDAEMTASPTELVMNMALPC